jgi:hypothetical protein
MGKVQKTCSFNQNDNPLKMRFITILLNILMCLISKYYNYNMASRDSSVGIALGYGLDDSGTGVRFPAGTGNFSLPILPFRFFYQNIVRISNFLYACYMSCPSHPP